MNKVDMADTKSVTKDLYLLRGQILPRLRQLVFSPVTFSATAFGLGTAALLPSLPVSSMPIATAAANGITFASIAMGACLSAIILSLGLPGTERLRRWSQISGETPGKSALSDLIFWLVWAALSQVALIATCALAIAFGNEIPLAPPDPRASHSLGLAVGLTVFFYALFELIVAIQTLSQIGVMIIAEEQKEAPTSNSENS